MLALVKFGIIPINVGVSGGEQVAKAAQRAEEIGLESVWTFEHAIVPVDYDSKYPYSKSGKMPATPETAFVDPLIALAFAAGATTKLKLGTGIHILPQHNPLAVAKQVASLDFLSGGRLLYGVGVGWLKEEFEAMGTPFERRGARFDDYLAALKKVWSEDVVEHDGEFVKWSGFKSYPLPAQRPHPPLIIGGTTKAAIRRVARLADGYFPPNKNFEQLSELLSQLRAACDDLGRDASELEITAMCNLRGEKDQLGRYEELGVSRLLVPLASLNTFDPVEAMDVLADLLPKS